MQNIKSYIGKKFKLTEALKAAENIASKAKKRFKVK